MCFFACVVSVSCMLTHYVGQNFVWPSDVLPPRLCQLRKWQDQPGYGFSLNAEKGKMGQYIGQIDQHSPAQTGGLQEGDKVLAVDGEVVEMMPHDQVVHRIKANEFETKLLVVRPETDIYLKMNRIPLSVHSPFLVRIDCPNKNPFGNVCTRFVHLHVSTFNVHSCKLLFWH